MPFYLDCMYTYATTSVLIRAHNTHVRSVACTTYIRTGNIVSLCALSLDKKLVKQVIKNEVGCRDDTVPKTVGTRRHCEEE